MNERLKELAEQAFDVDLTLAINSKVSVVIKVEHLERFAELVRADEREAVIDIVARHGGSVDIEAAVRQRGEK